MAVQKPPLAGAAMTPRAFVLDFIRRWEDGGSTDPNRTHTLDPTDNGNWSGGRQGLGRLVGSNHGVTAAALAAHRGVPAGSITRDAMHALTIDEAADIALTLYYVAPSIDLLAWDRVAASALDMGWGAGPPQAIKLLQRLAGCADDGCMGPGTTSAVAAWIARIGEAAAATAYGAARVAFYDRIIALRPANAKYRAGWLARTAYYLPGDPSGWWTRAAA